jgi:hypothetical protein
VLRVGGGLALGLAVAIGAGRAQTPDPTPTQEAGIDVAEILAAAKAKGASSVPAPEKKFRDFAEVTAGATKLDGLFNLYRKDDRLYAEIKPNQFEQPFLVPTTIARGAAQAGMPVNNDDEMVLVFKRVGDRIQLIRRNVHYKAPAGTPIEKSVKQNYTDSVLLALPIVSLNPAGMGALIDLNDIFLSDFAQLGLGPVDRSRTSWYRVKAFPNNLELEVETTFAGRGGNGVIDPRGATIVVHYSVIKAPDAGYRPRVADQRVGHFLSATKDFGSESTETNFVRYINRWRLEKADPRAKLSPPKKQIIWYVEDTVPFEYRPYVEAGIREWNKAFEKIGFREAIAVRWQQDGRDDFDPEDTNYCTFRWVTTDAGFAMSCLRANPLSGEMIDGDVVFDASFIRFWKQEYALLVGAAPAPAGPKPAAADADGPTVPTPLAIGEIVSPILASKLGYGQPGGAGLPGVAALDGNAGLEVIPSNWNPVQWALGKRAASAQRGYCQYNMGLHRDFTLAALALADPEKKDKDAPLQIPEEFIGQAIKEVVMHEVGHSLGLRHNFKASTMLKAEELNDTSITRAKGLVASVMDYSPVNIAPPGQKQGDYYTTTLGPYDYWAIEYAYKPVDGSEAEELKKIASRAPEAGLQYATDEDAAGNNDPYVNRWDLGSDPCQFAKDRIALASQIVKTIDQKAVKDGESWARMRAAFSKLLGEWGDAATLASAYIGGQSVSRHFKGDKDAKDPVVPVAGEKQRECLNFLVAEILSDKAFQFSPALLRRLTTERWYHWGSEGMGGAVDFPVLERVSSIQRIVLAQCLAADTLSRLQNQELQAEPGTNPLKLEEVFRALSDGVFSDLNVPADAKEKKLALSTIRRNLQREYLKRLSTMVLGDAPRNSSMALESILFVSFGGGGTVPADARALARLHLKQVGDRIGKALESKDVTLDDTTRAHLEECREKIAKVLAAPLNANGF